MGQVTKIVWCHHTFNPWIGCTKVHDGCTHCYAERDMDTRLGRVAWGPRGTRSKTSDAKWREPLKWAEAAGVADQRRRVFCASLADVFEDWHGDIIDHEGRRLWVDRDGTEIVTESAGYSFHQMRPLRMSDLRQNLFRLIDFTPELDWLVLTKRPENVQPMIESLHLAHTLHRTNLWLGASVSDQRTADVWTERLLECRDLAPVLFLSVEPLLGPVDLGLRNWGPNVAEYSGPRIDWVIIGGESGPKARPCNVAWVRSIVADCREAGVPVFVEQLGADARLRDKNGGDPSEWPEDLRVREFPRVAINA